MICPRRMIEESTAAWLADPESDVVWAGDHRGRRGVRMRQTVRDATTVWFEVGQRTIGIEAYVLSLPPAPSAEVMRQALVRNLGVRRMHFALDSRNQLFLVGRIPVEELCPEELDLALGEVWDLVERSLRGLAQAGAEPAGSREKSR